MSISKKKIIIFVDWYLPGYKAGGPIRSVANMVAHLKSDFDFSLVTSDTDYHESQAYPSIKSNEWNLADGCKVFYFSKKYLKFRNLFVLLKQEAFDVVYLNSMFSFYYTILPLFILRRLERNCKIILAPRGMLAEGALSVKSFKKKMFLFFLKFAKLQNNIVFHATSEEEKKDISKFFNSKIILAPNLSQLSENNEFHVRKKNINELKLVNIARISPEKNLKFALTILQKSKDNITFDIFGTINNKVYWEECLGVIKEMPANITVNYKNEIQNHLIPELLRNYHFMFMPTLGENFGHVIIESLASGCPVIISDRTPWRNMEKQKTGWDISLSSTDLFVKAIENASKMDREEFNIWSKKAFDFSLKYINDPDIIEKNRNLFLNV